MVVGGRLPCNVMSDVEYGGVAKLNVRDAECAMVM